MAKSIFAPLERELLKRLRFKHQMQAKMADYEWIEGWYKPNRRYSRRERLEDIVTRLKTVEVMRNSRVHRQRPYADTGLPCGQRLQSREEARLAPISTTRQRGAQHGR
jgi:Flp pilus assembly CpaF family ATPase